jgi:hypothetical protein
LGVGGVERHLSAVARLEKCFQDLVPLIHDWHLECA